jgi:hypothetical protein
VIFNPKRPRISLKYFLQAFEFQPPPGKDNPQVYELGVLE